MSAHPGTVREAAYGRQGPAEMNIRQLLLDVDKAVVRPSLLEIAAAIDSCRGVEAVNIAVEEIDIETVGMTKFQRMPFPTRPSGIDKSPHGLTFGAQAMEFAFVTALRADDSFWRRWTTKEFVYCITTTN
jgi:hypothetical protein